MRRRRPQPHCSRRGRAPVADIVVRVRKPMIRCIMVDLPQADLTADGHLLNTIGRVNDTKLGLVVDVVEPGALRLGDTVRATLFT